MTDHDEIMALRQELAELRAEVEALRRRLGEGGGVTMRGRQRCPGCGGTRLLHAGRLMAGSTTHPDTAPCLNRPTKVMGRSLPQGTLEVWVCRSCALVEAYVRDLDGVDLEAEHLEVVDGAAAGDAGPYR